MKLPLTVRYQDDFQLEPLEIKFADYIFSNSQISITDFKKLFKNQGDKFETSAFQFESTTIEKAVSDIKNSFNLQILEENKASNVKTKFKTGKVFSNC